MTPHEQTGLAFLVLILIVVIVAVTCLAIGYRLGDRHSRGHRSQGHRRRGYRGWRS